MNGWYHYSAALLVRVRVSLTLTLTLRRIIAINQMLKIIILKNYVMKISK